MRANVCFLRETATTGRERFPTFNLLMADGEEVPAAEQGRPWDVCPHQLMKLDLELAAAEASGLVRPTHTARATESRLALTCGALPSSTSFTALLDHRAFSHSGDPGGGSFS